MSHIAVLTDSSARLPAGLQALPFVRVIPLKLNWKGASIEDSLELDLDAFYHRLEQESELPTTSQATQGEFLQAFDELALQYDGAVVLPISSGISGTMDAALHAAADYSKMPVEVVDTRLTTVGLELVVRAAIQAAGEGKSLAEVTQAARTVANATSIYFMVDSLIYLHKGGRINGASKFLGSALNIKPILYLNEQGKIDALERVRTRAKALERLVELAAEKAGGKPSVVGILHANAPDRAEMISHQVQQKFPCQEIYISQLSPVVAAHVGQGTVGIAVYNI